MEDPCNTPDVMDRDIPYTRKQHIVNMTHKVENSTGTKITITVDLTNKRQCLLRSAEGDVNTVKRILPLPCLSGVFPENVGLRFELDDDKCLWSLNRRLSLIHDILSPFNLISLNDHLVAELETRFSFLLLSALLNSNDEGYNVFDVFVVLEVATVDTYKEEVAQATSIAVAASALRSSIQALPSKATVTQLPCSDDCYRGCIERWVNVINSCPSEFFHLFCLFALYISFLLTVY